MTFQPLRSSYAPDFTADDAAARELRMLRHQVLAAARRAGWPKLAAPVPTQADRNAWEFDTGRWSAEQLETVLERLNGGHHDR